MGHLTAARGQRVPAHSDRVDDGPRV